MKRLISAAIVAALVALPGAAGAKPKKAKGPAVSGAKAGELVLHRDLRYAGEDYVITRDMSLVELDWNIKSISVYPGDSWEICAKPKWRAPCMTLTSSIEDAKTVGIEGGIGSARKGKRAK
jgi:hypothetical protein